MIGDLVERALEWSLEKFATRFLEERRISIDGDTYLRRFYLLGLMRPELAAAWNCGRTPKQRFGWLPTTYLHCFCRPDADRFLHNHPWSGRGMILTGGYVEERYVTHPTLATDTVSRVYVPGDLTRLKPDTYHGVTCLFRDVCWTVMAIGDKQQSWGYWNTDEGRHMPWRERHQDSNSD